MDNTTMKFAHAVWNRCWLSYIFFKKPIVQCLCPCINLKHIAKIHNILHVPILSNKSLLREKLALITGYYEIQKGPYSSLLHHRTIDICVDSAIMRWQWSYGTMTMERWCVNAMMMMMMRKHTKLQRDDAMVRYR